MSLSSSQRRDQLRALYGFDFPDDLFRFWEFVNRLQPLDPLHALSGPLGVVLVGPFEVLSGASTSTRRASARSSTGATTSTRPNSSPSWPAEKTADTGAISWTIP